MSRTILSSSNPRPFRDDRRGRGGGGGRGRGGGGYQRREQRGTNCVKVQGIPFNSSEGELCDFFDGYDVCMCVIMISRGVIELIVITRVWFHLGL